MRCQNCLFDIPDENAKICPVCGEEVKPAAPVAAEPASNEDTLSVVEAAEVAAEDADTIPETDNETVIPEKVVSDADPVVGVELFDNDETAAVTEISSEAADTEVSLDSPADITIAAIEEQLEATEKTEEADPADNTEEKPEEDAAPEAEALPAENEAEAEDTEKPQIEENPFNVNMKAVWPDWQIVDLIGRGSFGAVYRAVRRDSNVESYAAIKIISIPTDASEVESLRSEGLDAEGTRAYFKSIVDDFVSEIRLMETLKGMQNIVSVEDYKVMEKKNTIGWDIFIRMELLVPFNTYVCDRTMTEDEVIALGIDICTALEICAQRNVIHRDIKPENIFVNDFGYYKLGDFGIARKLENMTGGLSQKGTYNYMAPEVASNSEYDSRVDTYSLGIMLYRLMNNNRLPFLDTQKQILSPNDRRVAVERRLRGEALPAPCNASAEMAHVILRACAYAPEKRFASATHLKDALIAVSNGSYVIPVAKAPATRPAVNTPPQSSETILFAPTTVIQPEAAAPAATVSEDAAANSKKAEPAKDKKEKKEKKKGAGKVVAISIVSVILALVIGAGAFYFLSPAHNAYKSFVAEKYDDALATYEKGVSGNSLQQSILDIHLNGYEKNILDAYNKGNADLDTTHKALSVLASMGNESAKAADDSILSEHANDTLDKYSKKELTYEDAIAIFTKLKEYGYTGADNGISAVMDTYAKDAVSQFEKGKMDYATTLQLLRDLKKAGYKGADELINSLMGSEAAVIVNAYKNGELSYEEAIEELIALEEEGHDVSIAIQQITEAFALGIVEGYHSGETEFEEARDALLELEESGQSVSAYLQDIAASYAESVVEGYNNDEIEYAEALEILSELSEYYDTDEDIEEIVEEEAEAIIEKYVSGELTYDEAKAALALFEEEDYDVTDAYDDLNDAYCESIVTKYLDKELVYTEAVEALNALAEEEYDITDAMNDLMAAYCESVVADFAKGTISYKDAIDALNTLAKDGYDTEEALNNLMEALCDSVVDEYEAGEMDYETAKAILEDLISNGYADAEAILEEITEAYESSSTFDAAKDYYEDGDYPAAIEELKKIPADNANYEAAQKLLKQIYEEFMTEAAEQALDFADDDSFESALEVIEYAYDSIPSTEDKAILDSTKEEILNAHKTYVQKVVEDYIDDGDYESAFVAIGNASSINDDKFFTTLRTSTETSFVEYVTKAANEAVSKKNYKSALRILDDALILLPGNDDLEDLKDSIEDSMPTFLSELVVIDHSGYRYSDDTFTDSYGEKYDGYHWFDPCYENAHALINLNKSYTTFSCSVVAPTSMGSSRKIGVQIYLDGELAYEVTDFTKTTEAHEITLDVTGVKKLEIKTSADGYNSSCIAIVNATVE